LLEKLDAGDLKAQIAAAHALGKMGSHAIGPLTSAFQSTTDPERRSFVLYALGKIKSPEVERVVNLALEAVKSDNNEMRDTAARVLGKFAEVIPTRRLTGETVRSMVSCLTVCFADPNPGIRAKAVRSMGKLAKFGHLNTEEKSRFAKTCNLFLGTDDKFDWDRAFIVRKEAQEALKYCDVTEENE
jgi:HEAT repeat protein